VSNEQGSGGRPRLVVVETDEVSGTAAGEIARALAGALARKDLVHWATTGGSAAPGIYEALRTPEHRAALDWSRIHTWWGDDRFVPTDHPLSNVLPFYDTLLSDEVNGRAGIVMPARNVHPFPIGESIARAGGTDWCAARYAESLEELVPLDASGTPVLDLLILGVGPDGHVLSVFPGSSVWDAPGLCAGVPAPTHVEPHVARVTVHPRVVAAATEVIVITTGASKADHMAAAWAGGDPRELPVRLTRLPQATWILDRAAAAGITPG
jgi:6-phosphogluconolactonase